MAKKIICNATKEQITKYRKGELGELLKKHRDDKLDEIKTEITEYKSKNLKLVKYLKEFNEVEEIFTEKTKNDKNKKAYVRKKEIDKTSKDKVRNITTKTIANIEMCSCKITYATDFNFDNKKIIEINRCKNRFCPMCSNILSNYYAVVYQAIVDYIKDVLDVDIYFLTLTYPNVKGEQLEQSLRGDSKALEKFLEKDRKMSKTNIGVLGKLEVTYNNSRHSKSYKTYHPHYHYLLAVPKNLEKKYLNCLEKEFILQKWQNFKKDKTITQVDIQKLHDKNENGISSGILELTKYIAKDSNYLQNKEVFRIFYNSLKGKRQYRPSGIFREATKLFKQGKLNDYIKDEYIEYVYKLTYTFKNEKYKKISFAELTEQEKINIYLAYKDNIVKQFKDADKD